MAQEYSRSLLRVAIAQICQNLGWNSIHSTPLELLTDVLERYLFQLGKVTHRYAEQCMYMYINNFVTRKPDFVAYKQQRCRLVCAAAQSDQLLCYWLSIKCYNLTCYMPDPVAKSVASLIADPGVVTM